MPEKATRAGKVLAWMSLPAADGQQSLPNRLNTGSLLPPSIRDLGPAGLAGQSLPQNSVLAAPQADS